MNNTLLQHCHCRHWMLNVVNVIRSLGAILISSNNLIKRRRRRNYAKSVAAGVLVGGPNWEKMEMSKTVGQRTCLNFCPTCKFPSLNWGLAKPPLPYPVFHLLTWIMNAVCLSVCLSVLQHGPRVSLGCRSNEFLDHATWIMNASYTGESVGLLGWGLCCIPFYFN
jgi:hypothetical protein